MCSTRIICRLTIPGTSQRDETADANNGNIFGLVTNNAEGKKNRRCREEERKEVPR